MDEHLQRDGALPFHGADVVEGQLPGQNSPLHALGGQQAGGVGVVDSHLGAGVDRQTGDSLAQGLQQADILHDDSVHAHAVELGRVVQESPQLPVAYQGVGGYVDLDPVKMGQTHGFFKFVHREIVGEGPGGKALAAQIDRVRSVGDSSL